MEQVYIGDMSCMRSCYTTMHYTFVFMHVFEFKGVAHTWIGIHCICDYVDGCSKPLSAYVLVYSMLLIAYIYIGISIHESTNLNLHALM